MAYEQILYRVEERVAVVTLNRPDRLNAWTPVMQAEVKAAMRAASGDPQVRVIVLTGAGRGFCAGADMSALQGIQSGERRERAPEEPFDRHAHQSFQRTHSYFPSVPKPIIAAVNGPCAGLGMVIALYADMRFASQNAVFMTAFRAAGSSPSMASAGFCRGLSALRTPPTCCFQRAASKRGRRRRSASSIASLRRRNSRLKCWPMRKCWRAKSRRARSPK